MATRREAMAIRKRRKLIGDLCLDEHWMAASEPVWIACTATIELRWPKVSIALRGNYKSRPSALRAAHKAAERMDIDIRSIDGEAV